MILGMLLLAGIITVAILRDRIVNQPYREISVTGRGEVSYTPDIAKIILGVHSEGSTAQAALLPLNTKIDAILAALLALGVPQENVSTHSLSLYPQYYYPEGSPSQVSGYTADEQITVEVSIAESKTMVQSVIEAASKNGANQILGVTFEPSNIDDLKQEALIEAIGEAKGRAQAIADAAGVRLKRVIGWWENPISVPGQPIPYYDSYGYGGDMGDSIAPSVPTGTSEVIIEVNLNYSTK
mgnify:FL=1